jgi:hypothetical protein
LREGSYNGGQNSTIWSGAVVTGPNGNFNGVLAFWNVPTVSQPPEAQGQRGGWDSSSWAGIDGLVVE